MGFQIFLGQRLTVKTASGQDGVTVTYCKISRVGREPTSPEANTVERKKGKKEEKVYLIKLLYFSTYVTVYTYLTSSTLFCILCEVHLNMSHNGDYDHAHHFIL